jgi:anti-sigma regulatory factor (Ser/Thr protein kinase)
VEAQARVRMVARPSSVPAVRRFIEDTLLGWGRPDLVDDVALSATELATNAMLHTDSTYFEVELSTDETAVRMAVVDRGAMPARAIANRSQAQPAGVEDLEAESTTGRGLFIVSALASAWGVEDLACGTRVWAEFVPGTDDCTPRPPQVSGAATPVDDPDVRVIELRGCPPGLLLAHDQSLADVARELRLFGATHRDDAMVEAAEQIAEIVRLSAVSWDAARLVAKQAVLDGRSEVDIAMASADVADLPRKVRVLRWAVGIAESMMVQGLLMTLPAPAPVREWRDWVEGEMVGQATSDREPLRYADWRARTGLAP